MDGAPLFNEALRRKRLLRRRATAKNGAFFLRDAAAEDILARLADMRRAFPRILAFGFGESASSADIKNAAKADIIVRADEIALDADIACAPGAIPFCDGAFDAVIGPFPLHAANDPAGCLREWRRVLAKDGMLLAAFLGETTLQEFRRDAMAAEELLSRRAAPRFSPFIDVKTAGMLLSAAGFGACVADVDSIAAGYSCAQALIQDIRASGENGALAARAPSPPRHWTKTIDAAREAKEGGKGFNARFDIVCLTGIKE